MRAITLEGRLLPIVPCRDKAPICPGGFNVATTDPVAIAVLWQHCYSGTQVGVATGSLSGIDVLDVDPRKGGDLWYHQHRTEIPTTRMHETPSGGWHLIFRHSAGLRCSTSVIARGIDVKADGGGVVWHPKSGLRVLCEGPIAEWPQWILDLAGKNSSSAAPLSVDGGLAGSSPTAVPSSPVVAAGLSVTSRREDGPLLMVRAGEVPKALYFKVLDLVPISTAKDLNILKTPDPPPRKRVTGRHQRHILSILRTLMEKHENRNKALNDAAFCFRPLIARGIITYRAAESLLIDAATLNQYVAKDGRRAAILTIRSGLGAANRSGHPLSFDEGVEA